MKLLSILFLAIFMSGAVVNAQAKPTENGPIVVEPSIVSRLRSINILLHGSSVVKRIEVSGNENALAILNDARETYKTAVSFHKEGNDTEANKALNQSVSKLMLASKEAKTTLDDIAYQTRLYKDRLNSVESLLMAHRRVATTKGVMAEKQEIENQVKELIVKAQALVVEQKVPEAQIILNQGYVILKASIFSMHNGGTEHSPKDFPTIQDQYNYELDRAHSYRMLIFVLVQGVSPQVVAQIERLVNSADELVKQSEAQAAAGDHKAALSSVVSASRIYARAIQVGGVYIPAN